MENDSQEFYEPLLASIQKASQATENVIDYLFTNVEGKLELKIEDYYLKDVNNHLNLLHEQINLLLNLFPNISYPCINIYDRAIPIDFIQNLEGFDENRRPTERDIRAQNKA